MIETWLVWMWTEFPWDSPLDRFTQVTVCHTPLKAAHIPHNMGVLMILDTGNLIAENETFPTKADAIAHARKELESRRDTMSARIENLPWF